MATCRIGALYRTRPKPCYDRRLSTALLSGKFDFGIQMANSAIRLISHPIAIILHIGSKPCITLPRIQSTTLIGFRINRRISSEERRNFYHRLVYGHGDRIQILRISLKPQSLGF